MQKINVPLEDKWLDENSGGATLRQDIKKWLNQYCPDRWHFGFDRKGQYIRFDRNSDSTMFLIQWADK